MHEIQERTEDLSIALMYEDIRDEAICTELHRWCRLITGSMSQSEIERFCNRGLAKLQDLLNEGTHLPGDVCVAEQILMAAKTHSLALRVTQEMPIPEFLLSEDQMSLH